MKNVWISLALLLNSLTLNAHVHEAIPLPIVTISDTKLKVIELQVLNIETRITGNIAQTSYEMVFYNPNTRVLEGELNIPLLQGQAVVGYALEIDGAYRDAVVVNKAKAKESFDNTIRLKIDPAIIEKTLGNNYKLRFYPIPKKGVKKVKVIVEEVLSSHSGNYDYVIPFVSDKTIKEFSLDVNVFSNYLPTITGIENIEIKPSATGYFVEYQKQNIVLKKMIELKIPKLGSSDSYFQKSANADNWFMSIIDKKHNKIIEKTKPKNLEIIVDSSLNLGKKNLRKELDFLDKVFSNLLNCTVSLKSLNIKMHDIGKYTIANGDWSKLKSRLQNIHYNGAKDLSKLKVLKNTDEVIFFSNGINTFSDELVITSNMITINSSLMANHNNLKYISNNYINLLTQSTEDAFHQYQYSHKVKLEKISNNLSEVFIKDLDESYLIIGRIDGQKGSVNFSVGEQDYKVNIDAKKESKLLARVWAKEKIDVLSLHYANNKEEIYNLAKRHTIMTKEMSLIVLERIEDYVHYEIVPPKALQEKYYSLLEKKNEHFHNEENSAIEASVKLLEEQQVWYKKNKLDFMSIKIKEVIVDIIEEVDDIVFGVPEHKSYAPTQLSEPMPQKSKKASKNSPVKKISLKAWESNAPYLKTIKKIARDKQIKTYYTLQKEYARSIPFYLDMADFFYKQNKKENALLILSNILELDFEKSEYMRAFAFKLLELKFEKTAIWFFERVEELRPFEAQASRDLALCYERVGSYQKALDKHYSIITKRWDSRFTGSKIITINELNRLISMQTLDTSNIDKRLIANIPVEIRIVINWSTDNSDMDLWVIDPENEKTYYNHKESSTGGKISNDMIQGYGPEEFMIKKAIKGDYIIKVKYFASHEQKIMGETVIRAEIYTDYASGKEKRKEIVFRVKEAKEVIEIGKISYEK